MKKNMAAVILLILTLSVLLCGCYKDRMLQYYSDDSNYETLEVTILSINEEFLKVDFVSENVHVHYTYKPFELINVPHLCSELSVGDQISIITAPRYFYDNYHIPVVGISKGDKVYLDFETGKQNLLNWVRDTQ